jgi:hypothetical protein
VRVLLRRSERSPILTMDLAVTAVHTCVSAGHLRP